MTPAETDATPAVLLQRGTLPDAARGAAVLKLSVIADAARAAAGYLDLEVTHLGEAHRGVFEAYWDGAWIETSPPGITIALGHRLKSARLRGAAKTIVSLDVVPALSERPILWAMVVADGAMSPAVQLQLDQTARRNVEQ